MQVKIGPSYFKKEKTEYSNWRWAYIREAMQNCIDAKGSSRIDITTKEKDGRCIITFSNNGEPMDLDTLTGKLLSLGETGKEFNNTVGGFGKAKILLYFSQISYTIHSGTNLVTGEGGDYTISQAEYLKGTTSTVELEESKTIIDIMVERFGKYTQWSGTLTLNGQVIQTNLTKGYFRKQINLGRVYTNKQLTNEMVVRIGGIPMFTRYCKLPIIIEIEGPSSEYLTSNRDGIKYTYQDELSKLIESIATEGTRALKADTTTIAYWDGPRQLAAGKAKKMSYTAASETSETSEIKANPFLSVPSHKSSSDPMLERVAAKYEHSFFMINETVLDIPSIYFPHSFSDYSTRLLKVWVNIMRTIHDVMDLPAYFDVGFIFSDTTEAEYRIKNSRIIYSINPCKIIQDKNGTRFKKRYTINKDKYLLIANGVHEYTHLKYSQHDSTYATALTDNMAVILKEIKQFHKCFRV